jgi:TRAP-type C4-dicarboxylate transport system permease small subunit
MKLVSRMLTHLRRLLEGFELALLVLLLAALLLLSFSQVVLRQFDQGLLWADVLVRHMVLWIGMIGAALAASKSRHIRIDALGRLLKGPLKAMNESLMDLIGIWISWRLAHAAWSFLQMTIEFEEVIEGLDWPAWPLQAVIPAGFALMALHFLLNLLQRLSGDGVEQGA